MSDGRPQALPEASNAHIHQKPTQFETHPQAERLVDWFKANAGSLSPDVQIAYNDSSGFHLRAIRPLSSPLIVTCPVRLTLSHLNLDHTQSAVTRVDSPLGTFLGVLPDHVLTRLLLIEQRYLATKGEGLWQPYISCLPEPEAMTSSIWFDDDDLECLAGTNLAAATRSTLAVLTQEWEHAVEVLRDANVPIPDLLELNSFKWAATIVSSRSFSSARFLPDRETFPILFPVLDILNHSLSANIEWEPRPFEAFALKRLKHETVRPGEEIFNNYFPKQNGEWLLAYGFCLPDNPVEQFAIKMAIPPQMEEMLRKVGLYKADNVPFGMPKGFLDGNPNQEQQYLRTSGHPFGRYENNVPFLRGIPPWIVHLHFIMALQNLEIDPINIDKAHPPPMIVFDVLLKLHEAIEMKSRLLPITESQTVFTNVKQKYASIYRDGQAKIIHAIREELWAVFDNLKVHGHTPPWRPIIISTTEALVALETDFPKHCKNFKHGLETCYDTAFTDWNDYSAQIAALEEVDHPAEISVWTILLFVSAHLFITAAEKQDRLVHHWVRALLEWHPLPTAESLRGLEPALNDEMLSEFMQGSERPIHDLNNISPGVHFPLSSSEGALEKLGERVAHWANGVVEKFAFQLSDSDRILMYMSTDATDAKWANEEVEGGSQGGDIVDVDAS